MEVWCLWITAVTVIHLLITLKLICIKHLFSTLGIFRKNLQAGIKVKLITIFGECQEIFKIVTEDYIRHWKINQKKYDDNDFNINGSNLDKINVWCTSLGSMCLSLYETVNSLLESIKQLPNTTDNFANNLSRQGSILSSLLVNLIKEAFVVDQQPPQVFKSNTR